MFLFLSGIVISYKTHFANDDDDDNVINTKISLIGSKTMKNSIVCFFSFEKS